jgi:hypothetical protein
MKIWYAITLIGIVVNETQGVILTRIGVTLFQNNFTTLAFKSKWASADKTARRIHAHSTIETRVSFAFVHVDFTGIAIPT